MPKADQLHALEIQHNLLSTKEREALGTAIASATVDGHAGLSRVLLTLMGMVAAGKITHEQAEVLRGMAELLFTNLCAHSIHIAQGGKTEGDPLIERLRSAQAGAKKIRPHMLIDSEQDHEYGLEVLDKKGRPVAIVNKPSKDKP